MVCPYTISSIYLTVVNNVDAVFDVIILGKALSSNKYPDLPERRPLHLPLFKTQQLITIVAVLFFTGSEFGSEFGGEFDGELGKLIQNPNDFGLNFK